ncbi:MAG: hypothetical protein ACT4OZ_01365 [Gemmatimonadota bacterium]
MREGLTALAKTTKSVSLKGVNEVPFGFVADADFDPENRLVVLDDRLNTLSMIDWAGGGSALTIEAGSGGPGWIEPRAFDLTTGGDLAVADNSRRLHVLRTRAVGYSARETYDTQMGIDDICAVRGRFVAHSRSLRRNEVIFVLNEQGRLLSAFGEIYRSTNAFVNSEIARGRVACGQKDAVIAYAPGASIGELRAFGLDSEVKWSVTIDGYKALDISELPDRTNSMRLTVPRDGYHRVHTLIHDGDGHFILQVAFVSFATAKNRAAFDTLYTFAFASSTGDGGMVSTRVPPLTAVAGKNIASVSNHPAPVIRIFTLPP